MTTPTPEPQRKIKQFLKRLNKFEKASRKKVVKTQGFIGACLCHTSKQCPIHGGLIR